MPFEPILNEEFYTYISPDGNVQLMMLAPDEIMCLAVTRLIYEKGLCHSPHEMRLRGFQMRRVKVTIVDAESEN